MAFGIRKRAGDLLPGERFALNRFGKQAQTFVDLKGFEEHNGRLSIVYVDENGRRCSLIASRTVWVEGRHAGGGVR